MLESPCVGHLIMSTLRTGNDQVTKPPSITRVAHLIICALTLTACSTPEPQSPPNAPPPSSPTNHLPTTSASKREPPRPDPITISFAGDVHFEGPLRARLDQPESALASIEPRLSTADLTVVNLETSLGSGGAPEPGKRFTFQAPRSALAALAAAGVDVVTMANNHALDFGPKPTMDALTGKLPVDVVGVGTDRSAAFAPSVHTVRRTKIAVLGASMADDPTADPTAHWAATATEPGIAVAQNPKRLARAVRQAGAAADLVIVYLHWGVQGEQCPSRSQTIMAKALAEAGADIIVGSHAHELQGAGLAGDAFVAYGLGNFLWYQEGTTGVLTLTVDGTKMSSTWTPARIQPDGLPRFATGPTADQLAREFTDLRSCAEL